MLQWVPVTSGTLAFRPEHMRQVCNHRAFGARSAGRPAACCLRAMAASRTPSRTIICADALDWLRSLPDDGMGAQSSVYTSLPDISELPSTLVGGNSMPSTERAQRYSEWFVEAATLLLRKLTPGCYCIFLQSDVRLVDPKPRHAPCTSKAGDCSPAKADLSDMENADNDAEASNVNSSSGNELTAWLDKSALCTQAAQAAGCTLMWHKIVLTTSMDRRCFGRPSYSHLLCYAKRATYPAQLYGTPDIFDRGAMLWPRGIGLDCALAGTAFLQEVAHAKCVVDPFCGVGTVPAMANALGLDSIGVEIAPSRCKKAAGTNVYEAVAALTPGRRSMLGLPRGRELFADFKAEVHQLTPGALVGTEQVQGAGHSAVGSTIGGSQP